MAQENPAFAPLSSSVVPLTAYTGQPPLSQAQRLANSFVAPGKTFEDILRSATWWLPCVLLMVFALATCFVVDRQVGFARVNENQIHSSPKAEDAFNQLSPEQKTQRLAMGARITRSITYAIPFLLPVFTAVYALLLWVGFNFILGARTTFPQVFATCFYASLPYILLDLLVIAVLYLGGNTEAYDYKNPVGTNLAYSLPDASPVLRALLGRLDVIQLWIVGLTAYGMAVISRKSVMQSAMVVGALWLLGTLLAVGGAAIS